STVSGNTVFDNSAYGIRAQGIGTTVSGNEVYGNNTGITASQGFPLTPADRVVISGNIVHDNTSLGIGGGDLVSGTTVYGQSQPGAVGIRAGADVRDNVIFGNYDGAQTGNLFEYNRIFNNSHAGIDGVGGVALGNRIYSNAIGVLLGGGLTPML